MILWFCIYYPANSIKLPLENGKSYRRLQDGISYHRRVYCIRQKSGRRFASLDQTCDFKSNHDVRQDSHKRNQVNNDI